MVWLHHSVDGLPSTPVISKPIHPDYIPMIQKFIFSITVLGRLKESFCTRVSKVGHVRYLCSSTPLLLTVLRFNRPPNGNDLKRLKEIKMSLREIEKTLILYNLNQKVDILSSMFMFLYK